MDNGDQTPQVEDTPPTTTLESGAIIGVFLKTPRVSVSVPIAKEAAALITTEGSHSSDGSGGGGDAVGEGL